jgi:SAM-dependent methyltransferase
MIINEITFLPGLDKQIKFLLDNVDIKNKSVLVIGSNTERIALKLLRDAKEVFIIVDNQEDLLRLRVNLAPKENLHARYMEYSNTDFINKRFDIIYAQGSITRSDRNKIMKEIKKVLQPEGILCTGEIVSLTSEPPQFVKDAWNHSSLSPLVSDRIENYYNEHGFKIIETIDLTDTLKEFYFLSKQLFKESTDELSKDEIKFYKKLLTRIKHESDVYLKLGGNKHIGFKSILLKNADDEKG